MSILLIVNFRSVILENRLYSYSSPTVSSDLGPLRTTKDFLVESPMKTGVARLLDSQWGFEIGVRAPGPQVPDTLGIRT